ncbi:MAG: hypothetical protein MI892_13725, partial [Desulfobacterales bacterium]|nr:hypothetical protein [Desulfobacterales bacterium]
MECPGNVDISKMVSHQGNTYLCGIYTDGTLTIQGDTIHNFGGTDGFICKFDHDGSLQWLNRIGGSGDDDAPAIAILNDRVYVTGKFKSNILYFTPSNLVGLSNNTDSYLAEYDLDGNYINHVRLFSGTSVETVRDMLANPHTGNLAVIAVFKTEIQYTDTAGSVTLAARSAKDHILATVSTDGIVQDTAIFWNSAVKSVSKYINLNQDQGYYVGGDIYETIYFDESNQLTGGTTTVSDAFLVSVDANLDFQWARSGGSTGSDHVNAATADNYGNAYISGKSSGDIVFDSTSSHTSASISGFGGTDFYLAKYNKNGVLQWLNLKGSIGNDNSLGLAQNGELVQFCGNTVDTVIFNNDTLKSSSLTDV